MTRASSTLVAGVFAVPLLIGLASFFVGLQANSYWYDELFTLWIVGPPDHAEFVARASTDLVPPVYYLVMRAWTGLFGLGEPMPRLLSALTAGASILLFCRFAPFTRPARLFAGALASTSLFMIFQSQNARSYGLCAVIVSGLMILGYRLLLRSDRSPPGLRFGIGALAFTVAFIHPFGMLTALGCLATLFLLKPGERIWLAALAIAVAASFSTYHLLVVVPHTQFSISNWIPAGLGWILDQSKRAFVWSYGIYGALALLIVGAFAVFRVIQRARADGVRQLVAAPGVRVLGFALGPPIAVYCLAVGLSLVTPSFTERNFLVVSPFLWAATASLYDLAFAERESRLVWAVALCTLLSATVVQVRGRALNEPYREAAALIERQPGCRGAPTIAINFGEEGWTRGDFGRVLERFTYGHYLGGGGPIESVYVADLIEPGRDPATAALLDRMLADRSCPVLAWSTHLVQPTQLPAILRQLNVAAARHGARVELIRPIRNQPISKEDYAVVERVTGKRPPTLDAVLFVTRPLS